MANCVIEASYKLVEIDSEVNLNGLRGWK